MRGLHRWIAAGLMFSACTSENPSRFGDEGAKCYPNGTCNVGLACEAAVCVIAPDLATSVDLSRVDDLSQSPQLVDLRAFDDLTPIEDLNIEGPDGLNLDLSPAPIASAKAMPVDQPVDGSLVYAPLAGIGIALESTGSSDPAGAALSFEWTVTAVPAGSAVTTATLTTASAATSGFVPDLGGDYTIELAVSTSDARQAKKTITISVRTAPLFFMNVEAADMLSLGQTLSSIRSDGTGRRALGCPAFADVPLTSGEDSPLFGAFAALSMYRAAYGTPDSLTGIEPPARIIGGQSVPSDMGGLSFRLFVAEEDSDCATKPPRAVPTDAPGTPLAPVWAPDRTRFLYSVVGNDDLVKFAVATDIETTPITGLGALVLARIQPTWIDDTTILFLAQEGTGPNTYKLYTAKLNGAVASDVAIWADCTAQSTAWLSLQGLEYRNGSVFVGVAATDKDFYGFNVLKVTHSVGGTTCDATNLTQTPASSSARDFSVSPDGRWLVFAKPEVGTFDMKSDNGGAPDLDLHIMEIETGVVKKLVGAAGTIEYGPQFIAGGRQIMYNAGPSANVFGSDHDMRGQTVSWSGVSVVNLDGSNPRGLVGGVAKFHPTGDGLPFTFFGPISGANYFPFGGCVIDPLQSPLSSLASGLVFAAALCFGFGRRKR